MGLSVRELRQDAAVPKFRTAVHFGRAALIPTRDALSLHSNSLTYSELL